MTIDDHVLEHILFYHGLTGTSPENEKQTRILRADIKEALARKNSAELSLSLKLPPTLWEERIKNIVADLDKQQQQLLIKLLLPMDTNGSLIANCDDPSFAVIHEDWQVRANAANILVFLNAKEAVPTLIESLNTDTTGDALSFCYIAYALGKLQGIGAREALELQLTNRDPWLRTDAAGALAYYEFEIVSESLAKALMQEQEALDYMAYAISRQYKAHKFLQAVSLHTVKAGAQLIAGIIEAAENSFNSDLIIETESHLCLVHLIELMRKGLDPLLADTAIDLCNYLLIEKDHLLDTDERQWQTTWPPLELEAQKVALSRILEESSLKENILATLKIANSDSPVLEAAELTHTLKLAGKLNIVEAQPLLINLLHKYKSNLSGGELKHVMTALGQISGDPDQISMLLIDYVSTLVDINERCQLTKSKQPVFEENTAETKIYWQVLQTLANLPTARSVSFLFQALKDYAPDKRSCALDSLTIICEKNPQINLPQPLDEILQEALKDPAPMMQLSALLSIARLNRATLIENILPLIDAQENTISKQALSCLDQIAKSGHQINIKTALKDKYKDIKEEHKRKRVMDILQK